jgi:superfamily II DNA or RNA helicase
MLSLRPYQLEAIKAIDDSEEDCVVKMFCGTGKSRIMLRYVTDRLEQFPYAVFVFPSLALITQFQDDYLKNIPNVLSVSSEHGSTTDQVIIKNFIESHEQKIICVTYQSLQTWNEVSPYPDIMMFDEAHHAVESYVSDIISDIECKKVFMTATPPDDDELGPIVYEYTHHDGVIEGNLNDFNIMIDFSTENTNESIYDSMIRAVMKTRNSRVLSYHQRVNTDDDTSVKNFVNQELLLKSFEKIGEEFPGHGYTSVKFLSIDAGTSPSERKKNLKLLVGGKEHEIVILSSCKTIGEGVDTKKANMVVFVDAKNSLTDIIQNIGRIVRKQPRDSTILIPCWVDKTKYDGAEDKDAVIREDLGKQGNFNGILNVISALRQHDPELYDLCLKYPKVFTKEEMKKNFEKQGVKDTGKIFTQKEIDVIEEKMPDVELEIHTHDVENPIEIIHPEAIVKKILYKDEDGKYHEMKPKNKKNKIVPPRKKLFDIHSSDEIRVDWLITEESLGNAYIDCIVTTKIDKINQAKELVQWVKEHDNKLPSKESKDKIEKSFGHRLSNWKITLKGNKLVYNVKEYLDTEIPGWSDTLEEIAMKKAIKIVQWVKEHDNKLPSTISKDKIEKSFGHRLSSWKEALKGTRNKLSNNIKEYLDKEIHGWSETVVEASIKKAIEIVQWVKEHDGNLPSTISKDKIEKSFGSKLGNWKTALKGDKLSDNVKEYLDTEISGWCDTLEEIAMKKAFEIVQWVKEHDSNLPSKESKDKIEKSFGSKIGGWKRALKGKSNNILPDSVKEYLDTEIPGWSNELIGNEASMKKAIEIVQWVKDHGGNRPNSHSKDKIEKSLSGRLGNWKRALKGKGTSNLPDTIKEYLDTEISGWTEGVRNFKLKICDPHKYTTDYEDYDFFYEKCETCGRKHKRSRILTKETGYTAPNPEKKLEINIWLSQQEYIPGKAIVLDAKDMKTCNLLPFDPSNIIVAEYDTDTFEENSKDPKFGKCLVNGDFLEVLKTVDPSELSLIYADFTGSFDKFVKPLLEYLSSIKLNTGTVLVITWSENGSKEEKLINKHMKELGQFQGSTWSEIQGSPSHHGYGRGANMYVEFMKQF